MEQSEDKITVEIPKRRGRKRKSELVVREFVEDEDFLPKKTVSRRGRPRKKVNYYELANPDNGDSFGNSDSSLNYFNFENEEKKIEKIEEETVSIPNDSTEERNVVSNGTVENGSATDAKNSEENVEIETQASTSNSNPRDNKKYSFTGETVKMMNTLFNMLKPEAVDETTVRLEPAKKRIYRKSKKAKEDVADDGSGTVTCAICNKPVEKTLWNHHKQRYHNNLAWRIGDEPLNLNDQIFVTHTLNALYKRKKPLYCDKCGEVKKSVVGFLSHRSQCLKSDEQLESVKVACTQCGRKMLPVSMSTHLKLHTTSQQKVRVEKRKESEGSKALPSKRSAAKKAMRIIENATKTDDKDRYFSTSLDFASQPFALELLKKELNDTQFIECKFQCNCITTNMEDALKHMEECTDKLTEGFVCKQCLLISNKLEDIIYHIESAHDLTVIAEDEVNSSFIEQDLLPLFLRQCEKRKKISIFPEAFNWTMQFCQDNYSILLYENFVPDKLSWLPLSPEKVIDYLPKLANSCDIAFEQITQFENHYSKTYEYYRLSLHESLIAGNKLTLFCGGPITSLAWLPTPHNDLNSDQILAVAVLNTPDEKYAVHASYSKMGVIQFWNFGGLPNGTHSLNEPKLLFYLAHSHGPIWHMEWCPSGCYGDDRMGLLATTGASGAVYIYSVPFLNENITGLCYKPKAVIKLLLQRTGSVLVMGLPYSPSKISWSKALNHQFIAVGYTNGYVALFSLKTSSPLLSFTDNENIPCLLPFKSFQAHSQAITALTLHHLSNGCRWLMTASHDRNINIWDLENHTYPICSTKRNVFTDGFWFTNWLSYAVAQDEGTTTINFVCTVLKQVRDFLFEPNAGITYATSTISALAGSDWLNCVLHATRVGEIVGYFPHQILHMPENCKSIKERRLLFGYAQLLDKKKTPSQRHEDENLRKKTIQKLSTKRGPGVYLKSIKNDDSSHLLFGDEPVTYDEAQEKYALLFCDNQMVSLSGDFPKSTSKQLMALTSACGAARPNAYPLEAITKIVLNPNRQSSLYYATGYQAGFVRISWMEFLKHDRQVM